MQKKKNTGIIFGGCVANAEHVWRKRQWMWDFSHFPSTVVLHFQKHCN